MGRRPDDLALPRGGVATLLRPQRLTVPGDFTFVAWTQDFSPGSFYAAAVLPGSLDGSFAAGTAEHPYDLCDFDFTDFTAALYALPDPPRSSAGVQYIFC